MAKHFSGMFNSADIMKRRSVNLESVLSVIIDRYNIWLNSLCVLSTVRQGATRRPL
jgi:hypothetical protein